MDPASADDTAASHTHHEETPDENRVDSQHAVSSFTQISSETGNNSNTPTLYQPQQEEDAENRTKLQSQRSAVHSTVIDSRSQTISLQRCMTQGCCSNMVHCPFCDMRQYKPTQPARVKDHLHKTHFQHAVYYDGQMIIKCFHDCRGSKVKGGHYHCPVCSTTLLKRNAFTHHLSAHAELEHLDADTVQAPDSKHPAFIYFQDYKIPLCQEKCSDTLEAHYHCPLCQRTSPHLAGLTAHLWRCKKKAVTVHRFVDNQETVSTAELFSPELVKTVCHPKDVPTFKWHLSVVRNLSDLPLARCTQADCCKGRYHCPLCTIAKLKPNHLCHMRQHYVSHWRSGVPFGDYTVLVCYLPCEERHGTQDKVRFHYHCPLCGSTRRRREAMTTHLVNCDPSHAASVDQEEEELDNGGYDDDDDDSNVKEFSFSDGVSITPTTTFSQHVPQLVTAARIGLSHRSSADQAELQAAESLVDMDRLLKQSAGIHPVSANQGILESSSEDTVCVQQHDDLHTQLQDNESSENLPTEETSVLDENSEQPEVTSGGDGLVSAGAESEERELEVFQQVATQVSGKIVSELKQRGELNACLEAIQTICNVTWTDSGDTVSMSCHMDDLCHAQNCLRQVLKEGLQSFLKSPPAKPSAAATSPAKSSTAKSPVSSTAGHSNTSPQKSGRKRGRPRGSRNKQSLPDDCEDYIPSAKQAKLTDTTEEQVLGKREKDKNDINHFSPRVPSASGGLSGTELVTDTNAGKEDTSGTGYYRRRTRGKKINFAQLNSGGVSPSYDNEDVVSTSSQTVVSSPLQASGVKRGRGRPRKTNPAVTITVVPSSEISHTDSVQENPTIVPLVTESRQNSQSDTKYRNSEDNLSKDRSKSGNLNSSVASQLTENGSSEDPAFSKQALSDMSDKQNSSVSGIPGTKTSQSLQISAAEVSALQCKDTHSSVTVISPQDNAVVQSEGSDHGPPSTRTSPTQFSGGRCETKWVKSDKLTQTPLAVVSKNRMEQFKNTVDAEQVSQARQSCVPSNTAGTSRSQNNRKKYSGTKGRQDFAIIPTIVFDHSAENGGEEFGEGDENTNNSFSQGTASSSAFSESFVVADEVSRSSVSVSVLKSESTHNYQESSGEKKNVEFILEGLESKSFTERNLGEGESEDSASLETARRSVEYAVLKESSEDGRVPNCTVDKSQSNACPLCSASHETYPELCSHIKQSHLKSPQLTCDVCEIACPTNGALMVHIERRHGPKVAPFNQPSAMHICSICQKAYPTSKALQWHRSFIHKQGAPARRRTPQTLKCTFCGYQAADPWDMRHHRERHRDHPAACPVCNKVLSTENAVKVHVAAVHSKTSFSCPICSKTFAHIRYLRSHMRRHGGEKRHECGICGWRFHETNTLRAHMDTHKPRSQRTYAFKCPLCPAAYNSRANYRDHTNKHTGARPHLCSKCGRGFAFRSMLTTHIAFVHSDQRPHACSSCPKTFKTRQQLRQHSLLHTGDSPHVCASCGRAMVSSSRLKAHIKRCKGRNNVAARRIVIQDSKVQTVQLLPQNAVSLVGGQQVGVLQNIPGKPTVLTLVSIPTMTSQAGSLGDGQNQPGNDETVQASAALNKQGDDRISGDTTFADDALMSAVPALKAGTADISASGNTVTSQHVVRENVSEVQSVSSVQNVQHVSFQNPTIVVSNGVYTVQTTATNNQPQNVQSVDNNLISIMQSTSSPELDASNRTQFSQMLASQSSSTLQTGSADNRLVNISVAGASGETQTILLPPDLIKQEVLIIESEDGQQSLINLASVQMVQSDGAGIVADAGVHVPHSEGGDDQGYQNLQTANVSNTCGALRSVDTMIDATNPEYGAIDTTPTNLTPVLQDSDVKEEDLDSKMAIFVCSTCEQAFGSLAEAEQHILSEHCEIGSSAEQNEINVNDPLGQSVAIDSSVEQGVAL